MIIQLTSANRSYWATWGAAVINHFWGTNNQAVPLYIQFHECPSAELISGTTVPKFKSFHAPNGTTPANGFDYIGDNLRLKECTIAVSTTELVWTDPGANGGLDWTVEVDSQYGATGVARIAGDTTTGVNSLTVWADSSANAGDVLYRVDYTNGNAATIYLMLFADPTVSNGATPLQEWKVSPTGSLNLNFGTRGLQVQSPTAGTTHYGCFLVESTTAGTLTAVVPTASNIRAIYL